MKQEVRSCFYVEPEICSWQLVFASTCSFEWSFYSFKCIVNPMGNDLVDILFTPQIHVINAKYLQVFNNEVFEHLMSILMLYFSYKCKYMDDWNMKIQIQILKSILNKKKYVFDLESGFSISWLLFLCFFKAVGCL